MILSKKAREAAKKARDLVTEKSIGNWIATCGKLADCSSETLENVRYI